MAKICDEKLVTEMTLPNSNSFPFIFTANMSQALTQTSCSVAPEADVISLELCREFIKRSVSYDSHIIHIAGVRHLLNVNADCLLNSCQDAADGSLYQVLDVHEAAPDVAHVIKRIGCWTWVPESKE